MQRISADPLKSFGVGGRPTWDQTRVTARKAVPFPGINFLFEFIVLLVGNRFEPLVGRVLGRHFHGDMGKPAVLGCPVPVFGLRGNIDNITGNKLPGRCPAS